METECCSVQNDSKRRTPGLKDDIFESVKLMYPADAKKP